MTPRRFVLASLRHYRRTHLAVASGVAVAAAVLTGALLVGDSVRGSLRALTLERLGQIDSALVAGHFFRAALATELAEDDGFKAEFAASEPAILLPGTLQAGSGTSVRRATKVSLLGVKPSFWQLGVGGPRKPLQANEIAITEPLARELAVNAGDRILIRVPAISAMPSDSVLGEKSETSRGRTFVLAEILPVKGLARFAIAPSQHLPRNAFLPLGSLQELIEQPDKANAILVSTADAARASSEHAQQVLRRALRPTMDDYGLTLEQRDSPHHPLQLASGQLVLAPAIVSAAERAFGDRATQAVITYLANTISLGDGDSVRKIPYSTITGVDSTAELGPLLDDAGNPVRLADDEIALNRWAADDLGATIGDRVSITFYEPESTHGQLRQHPPLSFRLAHIAELKSDDGTPTLAADRQLTPVLPGVTDQASINDWDLPFELVERIRGKDEAYWDEYRTTPKAFVSLSTAKRLWASRWGTISLLRIPREPIASGLPPATLEQAPQLAAQRLAEQIEPDEAGLAFLPLKARGLAAASGTTPFDGLFLGFSFFLILAAIMLIAVLFQLGIEQRAGELGILGATGVGRKRVTRLLSSEGLAVTAVGALAGVFGGTFYAWLMITGLRTWWLDAIATPFLNLHVTWRSLVLGWLISVLVSWLAIYWSIRKTMRLPTGRLLAARSGGAPTGELRPPSGSHRGRMWRIGRIGLIGLLAATAMLGIRLQGEAQAGAFFASGALTLALALGEIRQRLRAFGARQRTSGRFSLASLAIQNIARNPPRSTLILGLVSAASFLVLAISAFRLESSEAGTGGFELLATSDVPIHYDLNSPSGQVELGISDETSEQLANWNVFALRVADGEDASCLNLYRPTQPRVLGLPPALIDRGGFAWGATAAVNEGVSGVSPPSSSNEAKAASAASNPWIMLERALGVDDRGRPIIPAVLDMSTAYYSLHLRGVGDRLEIRDGADQPVTLQIVGLLKNSMLQGNLLISEANFVQLFPDVGGYRYFLLEHLPAGEAADGQRPSLSAGSYGEDSQLAASALAEQLESALATEGFDAVDARDQLAGYLAVQNTYLSTFQTLGLLGLLLGTVGLAAAQLRSVLERRGELALMRASGFTRKRLVQLVLCENAALLVGGLATGSLAAAVATLPQWARYDAAIPWIALMLLLGVIAIAGLLAAWLATRAALRAPLLPALRGD